jgi:transcriptional regulator with XRE-family HTH domain
LATSKTAETKCVFAIPTNVCVVDNLLGFCDHQCMDENELYRALGSNISTRRRSLGLTQATLADHVGLSRASLANIERGNQKVLLHHVYRIADALALPDLRQLLPTGRLDASAPNDFAPSAITGVSALTEAQRRQIESLVRASNAAVRGGGS